MCTCHYSNPDKVAKIVAALNLKIAPRDLKSKDTRYLLSLIFSQWLSLSTCTFQAVVEVIPPPSSAQKLRIPKMLFPELQHDRHQGIPPQNKLEEDLYACNDGADAVVVAYVSKTFAVPKKDFPENKRKTITAEEMRARKREIKEPRQNGEEIPTVPLEIVTPEQTIGPPVVEAVPATLSPEDEDREVILGFARLYSGTVIPGSQLYCILPKYNRSLPPSHPSNVKHISVITVKGLYVMMGRELVAVEKVGAGNVFAIAGLEGVVWRNATLCAMRGDTIDKEISVKDAEADKECLVNLAGISGQVSIVGSVWMMFN